MVVNSFSSPGDDWLADGWLIHQSAAKIDLVEANAGSTPEFLQEAGIVAVGTMRDRGSDGRAMQIAAMWGRASLGYRWFTNTLLRFAFSRSMAWSTA